MKHQKIIKFESNELKSLLAAKYFSDFKNEVKIENRKKEFSFDDSFKIDKYIFDCGFHASDSGRSKIYDSILNNVDVDWVTTEGSRLLVFNNKIFERGYETVKIKNSFSLKDKKLYKESFLSNLEELYGSEFVYYSVNNIAKSYAQNRLWIKQKLSPKIILTNIYPWFFPRNEKDKIDKIKNHFHNDINKKVYVRYPKNEGFICIANTLRLELKKNFIKDKIEKYSFAKFDKNAILKNKESNTLHIWPIDFSEISQRFGFEFPKFEITNFYLVSVILKENITLNSHEILVGDNSFYIDRVSSPETLMGKNKINSIQFECENEDEISEKDLLENILMFSQKYLKIKAFLKYDIKSVKIKRFNQTNIKEKTNKIIDFLELKNPQLIILNRSLNYENIADGVPSLIKHIKNKL